MLKKSILSIGLIGSILLNQSVAFAGRQIDRMVNHGGAFLRVECWSKDGQTTLKVNVIPNSSNYPISRIKIDVELDGGRQETVEQYFVPTTDANAVKVIGGQSGGAIFTSGTASGINLINFHTFEQRKEPIVVSCD